MVEKNMQAADATASFLGLIGSSIRCLQTVENNPRHAVPAMMPRLSRVCHL
jgi:hypothetical protein